jgi:ABC-type glycerol-3-phosphate transport system permease component
VIFTEKITANVIEQAATHLRETPVELSESAQVDGCSRWQAFWKIDFPLAGPGINAAGICAFLIAWNEFAIANVHPGRDHHAHHTEKPGVWTDFQCPQRVAGILKRRTLL